MQYVKIGNSVRLFSENDLSFADHLQNYTYILKKNEQTGEFFLVIGDSYVITTKVYGDVEKRTTRILNSFNDKKDSMGVLLVGTKGSGKTLLSKFLSMKAAENKMPTIIINTKHVGEEFLSFINSINTPSIIIFDEFDKVYKRYNDEQRSLLTILDGVYTSKHLYIFTGNDINEIDSLLLNRPGRVYYKFEYAGLEEDFIRDYCNDNLKNKDHIDDVITMSNAFNDFNFDMLQGLVEEMNRYNESADDAVKWLNISPSGEQATYDVIVIDPEGKKVTNFWPPKFDGLDMMNSKNMKTVGINASVFDDDDDDSDAGTINLVLDSMKITDWLPDFSMFTYTIDDYKVVLQRRNVMKKTFGPWV